jgi:hypothetical protein
MFNISSNAIWFPPDFSSNPYGRYIKTAESVIAPRNVPAF